MPKIIARNEYRKIRELGSEMFINERDLDFVARDIVNQLSGLWEIDIDIRQSTIEKADDLVHQAIWDRIC